jgi:two-component system nitrogen regulation sensor histidine kinase NtrY
VTTREKGTGLGLAIVKRIMEDHEGSLVLTDARDGPGARVILRFPTTARLSVAALGGVEEMI